MEKKYPHIFTPIKLGNTIFRNRIFASPVSQADYSNVVGMTDRQKKFYGERARGGAASVATGDGIVHFETGFLHPYKLKLDDPSIYPALADMARTVRQYGAVATLELSHGGKFANVSNFIGNMETGRKPYGPDHEFSPSGEEIFEMPREMIEAIAASYGRAAGMAKAAGFGMVLIHAGHGWLLQQFMSPRTNHRTDEFGGSFENRMRFTFMVIDSVRAAVGDGFPIEFRMSGAEFTDGGYDVEYGAQIAKAVDGKVDLIHVSAGVHDCTSTFTITHPTMFREHGCNVYLAERIKKEVKTPVATIGALTDPAEIEDIIASGKADVVEMGRQLMADPYLPLKMQEGREEDITHCIRCFTCMQQLREQKSICCAVNPRIGREDLPDTVRTLSPKNVIVVGGGPAGLTAAYEAHKKGHKVILFEEKERLGGETLLEENIPFKHDMFRLGQTLAKRVKDAGIDVRTGCHFDIQEAKALGADVIIAAVGGKLRKPDISGIDGKNVLFASDLGNKDLMPGKKVVVAGGGLVGCESAIHFAQNGADVTIIGRGAHLAKDAPWPHQFHINELMEKLNIKVYTGYEVNEITGTYVKAMNRKGEEILVYCDSVFTAAGVEPCMDQVMDLQDGALTVISIGDCVKPGKLYDAITAGYFAGYEL